MLRRTLNLGILAHVDAGKTTLTERLLYAAGVIDEVGSVDDGSTQTDTLALERQRGITIKSAVVSFAIDDVTVNLIDTPGHPDFIAEVERVLSVLDGAVLVISAVEGVQPQTRILYRALQRLRVPTLLFVNKIDRRGAGYRRVLEAISERLTPAIVAMGSTYDPGTRAAGFTTGGAGDADFEATLASVLADRDDALLRAYVDDDAAVPYERLRRELAEQTRRALVHPVFFGSALTGAGVEPLTSGIAELLPAAEGEVDGPVSGTVFKIERGAAGEKIAYVRMFSGTVRTRDRLRFGEDVERKVTAIQVFDRGAAAQRPSVSAGEIGKLWGLGEIRIGDAIGAPRNDVEHHFAPPTLETVVVPGSSRDKGALRVALAQLAEQDPLIDVRQDDVRQELSVSLYGEVQKEVVQATLANEYGVEVGFRETTTICIERVVGTGAAFEIISKEPNPFLATVGLRVEPAAVGSGVEFRLEVELGSMPIAFFRAVEDDRAGDAPAGAPRMAGPRRRGHDDALRLLPAAERRAPGLRQGDVEHRRRLPEPDAARPDGRAEGSGHGGLRADPPLPPRSAGGRARAAPAGARPDARRPRRSRDRGLGVHDRGRHPGGSRARAAARAARADARRGRPGERVRPLRTGQRSGPDAAAYGLEPTRPQGVPPARDGEGLRWARAGCTTTSCTSTWPSYGGCSRRSCRSGRTCRSSSSTPPGRTTRCTGSATTWSSGCPSAAGVPRSLWSKECEWLPRFAPLLPLAVPVPLAKGAPGEGYPCTWAVFSWLEGETASFELVVDARQAALDLAEFLHAFHGIDVAGAPLPGEHNFFRGVPLAGRDASVRSAIEALRGEMDADAVTAAWEEALRAPDWDGEPVWIHGDLTDGNLLVDRGRFSGVIDWGGIAVADPACDLMCAWCFLSADARELFRAELEVDDATWARARGWALSVALIALPYYWTTNPVRVEYSWRRIGEILADHAAGT